MELLKVKALQPRPVTLTAGGWGGRAWSDPVIVGGTRPRELIVLKDDQEGQRERDWAVCTSYRALVLRKL